MDPKNDLALSVRSLGKAYSRGSSSSLGVFGKGRPTKDQFWALQDVSFDVPRGTGVGIIGGNGAGKSTLLKILARIVLPTTGEVEVNGKVNSLLEVGTGFQSDLSGRANIYLNASILGMSKEDVDSVFDEIVDFSGVGEFIDMPVKHYSSGMYSRLAFSVAANVTGNILLLDEVLSVGDAEFRKKCLGRMNSLLTSEQRTVLFVSHSMESVMRFCSKALWLDRGRVRAFGDSEDVVTEYLRKVNQLNAKYVAPDASANKDGITTTSAEAVPQTSEVVAVSTEAAAGFSPAANIMSVVVSSDSNDNGSEVIRRDEAITVELSCEMVSTAYVVYPVVHLYCMPRAGVLEEVNVFTSVGDAMPQELGQHRVIARIPAGLLTVGQYYVSVALISRSRPQIRHSKLNRVLTFQVIDPKRDEAAFLLEQLHGVIQPRLDWSCQALDGGE
jgi:ABC-type polysaccharide/polyol phosphate transport system ATPase subunit